MDQEADAIEVASFEQEGAGLKVVSEYEEIDERPTETDLQPNLEGAEDESHQLATSLEDPSTMPSAKDESILETEQEGHIAIAASYMEGSELGTPSYVGESSPLLEKRARSGAFLEVADTREETKRTVEDDEAKHLKGSLEEQKTDSPVKTEEQMSEIELDRVTINMSDVGAESAKGISSSSKDKKSSPFQLQMDVSQTSVRCIVDRSIGSQDNISDKEVLETAEDVKSVDTAPVDVEETGAAIQEPNLYEENAYGEKLAEIPGEFAANTWSKASTLGPADVPDVYLPFALVPTDEISKICYNINLINTKIRTITPNIARIVSRINSFDTQTQTDWTDSSSVALKITMMTWDLPNALTQVKKNVKDPVMFENMKTRSIKICRDIIHECDIVTIQFRDVIQRVSSTPQDRPPVRDLRRQVNEFCNKINPILDDLNLNIEQLSATKAIQPIVEEQEVIPEVPANNEEVDNQEESPSKLKRFSQYFYAVGASILIVGVISGAIFLITRFQKRDDDKFHTL